nr:hypothetical protein [Mycobacterium sp. E802]
MTAPYQLDLREVDAADVYMKDEIVAHLRRESGDRVAFAYVDEDRRAYS